LLKMKSGDRMKLSKAINLNRQSNLMKAQDPIIAKHRVIKKIQL